MEIKIIEIQNNLNKVILEILFKERQLNTQLNSLNNFLLSTIVIN